MVRKLLLLMIFSLSVSFAYSQVTKKAINALNESNVQQIVPHLDEQLELCILGEPDFVSKQEAVRELRQFLNMVKPESIASFHQGSSKSNDSKYGVANLVTQKGTYRVFIYTERDGNSQLIREIRIDKEE